MHMLLFCSVISCDLKITAAAAAMNSVEGAGEGEQGVLRDVQQGPRGTQHHRAGDHGADPEDALRGGGLQELRRRRRLAS